MRNSAEIVISAMDKATAVIDRIADRMDALGKRSDIGEAFDRLGNNKALDRVSASFGRMRDNIGRVAIAAGVAVGAVGALFSTAVGRVDDFADSLANAGVAGRDLEEFSALRDFMGDAGVTSEQSSQAILKLVSNISLARSGSKSMVDAFAAAGISVDQLKKKSSTDIIKKLMDNFSKSENAAAKLQVLTKIAGESSLKMAASLSAGTAGLEDYKKKYKNALLTEKDVEASGAASDSLSRIGNLLTRIADKTAAAIAPKFQKFLDQSESGLLNMLPKIVAWMDRLIGSVDGEKVIKFFTDVWNIISSVASAIAWLVSNVNTTILVFGALAAVFAPTLAAMFTIGSVLIPMITSGFMAMGAAMLANPIFLAIAVLAGAAFLVYKNWDSIIGKLGTVWDSFGEKIRMVVSWLPDWMTGGSVNVNVNGEVGKTAARQAAQTIAGGATSKTDVGGRIQIELTGAPAKVTALKSNNNAVPIDVNAGQYNYG
jgi:hypothetical protein